MYFNVQSLNLWPKEFYSIARKENNPSLAAHSDRQPAIQEKNDKFKCVEDVSSAVAEYHSKTVIEAIGWIKPTKVIEDNNFCSKSRKQK